MPAARVFWQPWNPPDWPLWLIVVSVYHLQPSTSTSARRSVSLSSKMEGIYHLSPLKLKIGYIKLVFIVII